MKFGGEYYRALYRRNLIEYKGKPPSIELINKRVKQANVPRERFEIIYDIPLKTILRYKKGVRGFPPVYWHIIYEFDTLDKFYVNFNLKFKRKSKTEPPKKVKEEAPAIANNNKSLIDAYRATVNK